MESTSRVRWQRKPQMSREPQTQQRKGGRGNPKRGNPKRGSKAFRRRRAWPWEPGDDGREGRTSSKTTARRRGEGMRGSSPCSRWCRCSSSSTLHMFRRNPTALQLYSGGNGALRVHQVPRERHKHTAHITSPPHPSPQLILPGKESSWGTCPCRDVMGGSTQRPGRKGKRDLMWTRRGV